MTDQIYSNNPLIVKSKMDAIEERYGEDIADAVEDILYLYNNPYIQEDPDVGDDKEDPQKLPGWNLRAFLNCFIPADNPLLDELVEGHRKHEWEGRPQ